VNGLLAILEKGCSDSMMVRLNLEIADEFIFNDPDTSRYYSLKALQVATLIQDTLKMAKASNYIGICHYSQGHYLSALEFYQTSQRLSRDASDRLGALKAMNNIGIVYTNMGEHAKAIETYQDAYEENLSLGYPSNAAYNLFNMAAGYLSLKDIPRARATVNRITALKKEHPEITIDPCSVMGEIYMDEHKPDSALVCFGKALELSRAEGDEYFMASIHLSMATAYMDKKSFLEAELDLYFADTYIRENGFSNLRLEYLQVLADLLYEQGLHSKAYKAQKDFITLKDSLDQINSFNRISELNARYESEKQSSQIARQEKMLNEKSSHFRLAIVGGGALCVFASLVLVNLIRKRRTNLLLKVQNKEIKSQRQKMLASIDYARRIQSAILPAGDLLASNFPDHFVFFRPRDIVSGDIYWCQKIGSVIYLAVIDCTGHGVPGAFMSLIAYSKMNKVMSDRIENPSLMLLELHREVVSMLHQSDADSNTPDGMDMSLCKIDLERQTIEFCGANSPICVQSGGQLIEYKANPYSIGGTIFSRRHGEDFNPFKTTIISYQPGDELFMFTDGMVDQLGGADYKKMNKTKFTELLRSVSSTSFADAPATCSDALQSWKKGRSQIDDILILGIRL